MEDSRPEADLWGIGEVSCEIIIMDIIISIIISSSSIIIIITITCFAGKVGLSDEALVQHLRQGT